MLSEFVVGATAAENLIVIRCHPGTASAVAFALDDVELDHVVGTVVGGDLGELLDLAARPIARALGVDALDDPARFDGLGEHTEAAACDDIGQIHELHAETHVGTVAAESVHGLFPRHARKRERMLDAGSGEHFLEHAFHHVHDVGLFDEGHLRTIRQCHWYHLCSLSLC